MKLLRMFAPVALWTGAALSVSAAEPSMILQDFDHVAFDGWDVEARGLGDEVGNFDGDGDRELRFTESGRKVVCKFKIKRGGQLMEALLSGTLTRLRFSAALPAGFVPATSPRIQVSFLTNVRRDESGKDVYGRVGGPNQLVLADAQPRRADFDLLNGTSGDGELFSDLLGRFNKGEGTYFMVLIYQVVPEGEVTSVLYDDFMVAAAEGR